MYKIELVDSYTRKRLGFLKDRETMQEKVFEKIEQAQDEILRLTKSEGGAVLFRVYDPMMSQDRPQDPLPFDGSKPRAWGRFG